MKLGILLVLGIFILNPYSLVSAQSKPASDQKTGDCSVIQNGTGNTASITCDSIDATVAKQVQAILNGTKQNESATKDISRKLDRIIKQMAQDSPQQQRSYLLFDGPIRFPERKDATGQILPDQHLQVGDSFFFDVHYKAAGPNPITLINFGRWLYLEPDSNPATQMRMVRDFQEQFAKEEKDAHNEPAILLPGDTRFFSVFAANEARKPRFVTAEDLIGLQAGTEVPFIVVEMRYTDQGKLHHTRLCSWLQTPPNPPGIWHFCEVDGFGSD